MACISLTRIGARRQLDNITLSNGEFGFSKDTNELFIGNNEENICLTRRPGDLEFIYGGLICKLYYKTGNITLDTQLETITDLQEILQICREALSEKNYYLLERELFDKC